MEKENTIKENLSFCLFGTTEQRKISLDLIEKCLIEKGIDISKCASQKPSTSDEALHIGSVGGSLLSDVVTKMDDGNYMISLIDGNKSYATYADNLPEMFERLADAFRAIEDVEQ